MEVTNLRRFVEPNWVDSPVPAIPDFGRVGRLYSAGCAVSSRFFPRRGPSWAIQRAMT
jgi:hypothetical protein